MPSLTIRDSATRLDASARGTVALCGSHGGLFAARLAARAGVRAAILNDAGVGKDRAGIAGLDWLDKIGIPACAADHRSARIGDGSDLRAHGVVSHLNDRAESIGVRVGMSCAEAAERLAAAPEVAPAPLEEPKEGRSRLPAGGHRPAWLLDSASLVAPEDSRAIIVTGSHGGLLGGREEDGIFSVDVFAALFNDAGGGKDNAGFARLPPLDRRGIAAATVSADTARIGEAWSTYETGVLSRVNGMGRRLGLEEGLSAREAVARLLGLA